MSNLTRAVAITLAIVGFLLLMLLVTRVGGVAIRHDFGGNDAPVVLDISTPIVRGAPVAVRWAVPVSQPNHRVSLSWRDESGEAVLGETLLHDQHVRVTFPCEGNATVGTVLLRQERTGQLLGEQVVTLLPAGVECAHRGNQ